MNTHVSLEIKQELFNKGWRYELCLDEGQRVENSLVEQRWNEGDLTYVDITIAEVVMWLYEKYGIWIWVEAKGDNWNYFLSTKTKPAYASFRSYNMYYHSPTKAYEAAIMHKLKNLIS